MKRDRRRFGFRAVVAVVAVVALLYGVGWERVLRNLRDADPVLFSLAPLGVLVALLAGAEGTRLALGFPARGKRAALARHAFLGAAIVRSFLPAGNVGGSGFVAYTVSRHGDVSVSEALAGVTSWEFVMMLASTTVCILGLAGITADGRNPIGVARTVAVFAVLLGGAAVVVAGLSRSRDRVADGVVRVLSFTHPLLVRIVPGYSRPVGAADVRRGLDEFFAALGALADDRSRFASIALAALVTRLCWVVPVYASLLAVGVVVSPAVAVVAVIVSGFARAVPLPAGIGPVDAALGGLLVALTPHSLGELASALVLNRGGTLFVQVVVGGGALWTLDAHALREIPTSFAPDGE